MDSIKGNNKTLVTGASGFVGSQLCDYLQGAGYEIVGAVRGTPTRPYEQQGPDLDVSANWLPMLQGVSTIVHCAARVHMLADKSADPLAEYRRVNVDGTVALARQAVANGVKRFIFLSSIKVNGESTQLGRPFTEEILVPPQDPYGLSKYEAELALQELVTGTQMEVVIVRLPLVYGPGVKANFLRMIKLVNAGIPLPFGRVGNRRSLLYVRNLCHFIELVINHPAAANETFLISDDEDVSTPQLLTAIGRALGKKSRLFTMPVYGLTLIAGICGLTLAIDRLVGSLQLDISKAKKLLGWSPVATIENGLAETINTYRIQGE